MSPPPPDPDLRRKLLRIEALLAGATTDGEREAAARARERVLRRLNQRPPPPPPAEGFTELPWAAPGASLPSREVLARVLAEWRAGERDADSVTRWAARVIDELVLPDLPPEHPDAARVEVLLVLAALHPGPRRLGSRGRNPLRPGDLRPIRAFLRDQRRDWRAAWGAWFAHLEARERGPGR